MGVFVLNKWKIMGGCKKWTFPQRRVHYVQYQYLFILHFTYLGDAYAPNGPSAYGPDMHLLSVDRRPPWLAADLNLAECHLSSLRRTNELTRTYKSNDSTGPIPPTTV